MLFSPAKDLLGRISAKARIIPRTYFIGLNIRKEKASVQNRGFKISAYKTNLFQPRACGETSLLAQAGVKLRRLQIQLPE